MVQVGHAIRSYFRSSTNVGISVVWLILSAIGLVATRNLVGPVVVTVGYFVVSGALIAYRAIGADRSVRGGTGRHGRKNGAVKNAEAVWSRIVSLRIPDPMVRQAVDEFLSVSGDVLASVRESGPFPNEVKNLLDDVLSSCAFYRRSFELHARPRSPSEKQIAGEMRRRTVAFVRRCTVEISEFGVSDKRFDENSDRRDVFDELDDL